MQTLQYPANESQTVHNGILKLVVANRLRSFQTTGESSLLDKASVTVNVKKCVDEKHTAYIADYNSIQIYKIHPGLNTGIKHIGLKSCAILAVSSNGAPWYSLMT
jgi:hypothetical protein